MTETLLSSRSVGVATTGARYVAPAALKWLRSARHPRALHVFDRAVYLIDDGGGVLLLATPPVPMGPFTILANPPRQSFLGLVEVDGPADVRQGRLSVSRLVVELDSAQLWPSAPDWRAIRGRAPSWPDHLAVMRRALRLEPRHGIFAAILSQGDDSRLGLEAELARRGRAGAAALLDCLGNGALDRLPAAALAGLGTGFTPSGDDFLMGVMFAFWAVLSAGEAALYSDFLFREAAPRTTRASAAWLAAAARGEAAEPWHRMVAALAIGHQEAVTAASRAILQTGHTSGEDALIGFVCGVASLSDSRDRRPAPEGSRRLTRRFSTPPRKGARL